MGYTHCYTYKLSQWPLLTSEFPLMVEAANVEVNVEYIGTPCHSIRVNGVDDNAHEPLILAAKGSSTTFTKTARKPYDLLVCLVLLRMKQLEGDSVELRSDGRWDHEWIKSRKLYDLLWPGENIACPWSDGDCSDTSSRPATRVDWSATPSATTDDLLKANSEETVASRPDAALDKVGDTRNGPGSEVYDQISNYSAEDEDMFEDVDLPLTSIGSINSLIRLCARDIENHADCATPALVWETYPGVTFRLIDVVNHCVLEEPDTTEQYVALSYVWGETRQLKLCNDTKNRLIKPGSLKQGPQWVSRTIRDAVRVCRSLNIRYLWVDALCIMQDNSRDQLIQNLRKRRIYASAYLTLVAAAGCDSNTSLFAQQSSATTVSSESEALHGTVLGSSSWTHQGSQFSHRKLIFASCGIYLSCQHSFSVLGPVIQTTLKTNSDREKDSLLWAISRPNCQLMAFFQAVSDFGARGIMFQSGYANTFQDFAKCFGLSMDGVSNTFFWGLPTSAFDQAACWQTDFHAPSLRRHEHPSWTWLGWQQAPFWNPEHRNVEIHKRTSIMLWAQRSPEFWASEVGQFEMKELKEAAENGRPYGDALSGHMYNGRQPCSYYGEALIKSSQRSGWGLPTNNIGYSQSPCLSLWGSIARLDVKAGSPGQEETYKDTKNVWYTVLNSATGFVFGRVKLDPVWREAQGEKIAFMLMDGVQCEDNGALVGTYLMCLEVQDNETTRFKGFIGHCERAAIVECATPIPENIWKDAGASKTWLNLY